MKIKLMLSSVLLAAFLLTGATCKNSRTTYTTLATSEQAAVQSYQAYCDQVISGKAPTNNLPAVSTAFNIFQLSMRAAVDAAAGNTNAPVTPAVTNAKANLDAAIKGGQ